MPRKTYIKMSTEEKSVSKEEKSEKMKMIKFNQEVQKIKYQDLLHDITEIQMLLYSCREGKTRLLEQHNILFPTRNYSYSEKYGTLSFNQSLVEIREKYSAFGVKIWKSFFTKIQNGGFSLKSKSGYSTCWQLNINHAEFFSESLNDILIELKITEPTQSIKLEIIFKMIQYSREYTAYHYLIERNDVKVLGIKNTKKIIDPIQKYFKNQIRKEMIEFKDKNDELTQKCIKNDSCDELTQKFIEFKNSK